MTVLLLLLAICFVTPTLSAESNIAKLEEQLLGQTFSQESSQQRLTRLEELALGQSYPAEASGQRETRLLTLLKVPSAPIPASFKLPSQENEASQAQAQGQGQELNRPEAPSSKPLASDEQLANKLLKAINEERSFRRLNPLTLDPTAQKMALEQANFLIQNRLFSSYGRGENNPDQRYTALGGTGKILELVDGFFAPIGENQQSKPIESSPELAGQLMDAITESTDKADLVFNPESNMAGIAFLLSPDKQQLVVVIELLTQEGNFSPIPKALSGGGGITVSGQTGGGYRLAWIGLAHKKFEHPEPGQDYFPPSDQVVYMNKSNDRVKNLAMTGGMILAMIAAPFTYGASAIVADVLGQMLASTYKLQDVQVREGVSSDSSGNFSGSLGLGEWGPGIYYVNIWGFRGRADEKPTILSRRTVSVR